jgi:hypothetical protein
MASVLVYSHLFIADRFGGRVLQLRIQGQESRCKHGMQSNLGQRRGQIRRYLVVLDCTCGLVPCLPTHGTLRSQEEGDAIPLRVQCSKEGLIIYYLMWYGIFIVRLSLHLKRLKYLVVVNGHNLNDIAWIA